MKIKIANMIAVLPMLMHSVFGCCWHHAHFHHEYLNQEQVAVEQTERLGTEANSKVEDSHHRCTHHHSRRVNAAETLDLSQQQPKSELPHETGCPAGKHGAPCDEDVCHILVVNFQFETLDFSQFDQQLSYFASPDTSGHHRDFAVRYGLISHNTCLKYPGHLRARLQV